MKRELPDGAEASVETILRELCGYSILEADLILKEVAAKIREYAIIEEAK